MRKKKQNKLFNAYLHVMFHLLKQFFVVVAFQAIFAISLFLPSFNLIDVLTYHMCVSKRVNGCMCVNWLPTKQHVCHNTNCLNKQQQKKNLNEFAFFYAYLDAFECLVMVELLRLNYIMKIYIY